MNRVIAVAGLLFFALGATAHAVDVDFTANLSATCSISLNTGGTLDLSPDGTILGSQVGAGTSAIVAVVSIGQSNITVGAPTLVQSPPGYVQSGQTLEVAYSGLLGGNQSYTTQTTTFAVGTLPLSLMTVNNRIVNSNGFDSGQYRTRTVITCS